MCVACPLALISGDVTCELVPLPSLSFSCSDHVLRLRDSPRVNGILVRYNDNTSDPSRLIPAGLHTVCGSGVGFD